MSFAARILGVCDAFDGALSGCRGTGDCSLGQGEALEVPRSEESARVDQRLVRVLCEALEDQRKISVLTGCICLGLRQTASDRLADGLSSGSHTELRVHGM